MDGSEHDSRMTFVLNLVGRITGKLCFENEQARSFDCAEYRFAQDLKSAFISNVACSTHCDQSFKPEYFESRCAYKMLRLAETIAPWPLMNAARVISPVAPWVP